MVITPRFAVVVVSKYLGQYGRNSATAYAIADRELANSIVSQKYDSQSDAQTDADRLNAGTAVTHADVKRRLLRQGD